MTAPENPLSRWSRLKRDTISRDRAADDPEALGARSIGLATTEPVAELEEPTNPEDLPLIDTITVDTDIRAFLKSRVPAELTRAALRQAWATDPAIRDFIGIAENQWDFNDPTSMPGFGPLQGNDDISTLLRQAFGQTTELSGAMAELPVAVESDAPAEIIDEAGTSDRPDAACVWQATAIERVEIEPSTEQSTVALPKRRTHGSALPR
jgi:hypothetical protein